MDSMVYELDQYFAESGLANDIYESLQREDKGDVVVTALEIMKKINKIPIMEKIPKQDEESRGLKTFADQCLGLGDYRNAFCLYNQALLRAPNNSQSLMEAYYGRAKLFYSAQANPSVCLADIAHCKHSEYQQKLKQMKADCQKRIKDTPKNSAFDDKFFNIGESHPKVPCVSAAVDFIIENEQPKVVAERNIPTGTVVAFEKSYIGCLHERNITRACRYCHAFSLNLIPCDSCRHALFCSENCKTICWEEYHNVECHIIHILQKFNTVNLNFELSMKAALKLKNSCSWKEFISLSLNLGLKQMTGELITEDYDVHNKASILRCHNERHFVFGATYNASLVFATIINYLERVPSFFPRNQKKKDDAIRALSRVLVHLFQGFRHIVGMENCAKNFNSEVITTVQGRNYGWFSFASKLKHSCDANLYVVAVNNKVALITMKPIKIGEELTISVPGHWYEYNFHDRALSMFVIAEIKCRCLICVEGWSRLTLKSANMNTVQRQAYETWDQMKCLFNLRLVDIGVLYKATCDCLNVLHNIPNTEEHKAIFDEFRRVIVTMQFRATNNYSILIPLESESSLAWFR